MVSKVLEAGRLGSDPTMGLNGQATRGKTGDLQGSNHPKVNFRLVGCRVFRFQRQSSLGFAFIVLHE